MKRTMATKKMPWLFLSLLLLSILASSSPCVLRLSVNFVYHSWIKCLKLNWSKVWYCRLTTTYSIFPSTSSWYNITLTSKRTALQHSSKTLMLEKEYFTFLKNLCNNVICQASTPSTLCKLCRYRYSFQFLKYYILYA